MASSSTAASAAPYNRQMFKCGLCNMSKPTHKRNNVEQHVWQHHSEQHGGNSNLHKYRAREHKSLVSPFIVPASLSSPSASPMPSAPSSTRESVASAGSSSSYKMPSYRRQASAQSVPRASPVQSRQEEYQYDNLQLKRIESDDTFNQVSFSKHQLSSGAQMLFGSNTEASVQRALAEMHFARVSNLKRGVSYTTSPVPSPILAVPTASTPYMLTPTSSSPLPYVPTCSSPSPMATGSGIWRPF